MRLESVKRIYGGHGGYVALMAGRSGQTASLTDTTITGLQATVRCLIDFDRTSQQRFLELFHRLKISETETQRNQHSEQSECQPALGV